VLGPMGSIMPYLPLRTGSDRPISWLFSINPASCLMAQKKHSVSNNYFHSIFVCSINFDSFENCNFAFKNEIKHFHSMEILTIDEIKVQYPDEWVLLSLANSDVLTRPDKGTVLLHSKDYLELCYKAS
jgi:hypothetical protein